MDTNEAEVLHKDLLAEYWDRIADLERSLKKKTCIAADRRDCKGKIIAAHTIPRSQLSHIAIDGHVTAFLFKDGRTDAKDRGVRDFSVLNCFCQHHDSSIFAPVERPALVFDDQQLTLLHYRAVGAEMYKKSGQVESFRSHIQHYTRKQKDVAKRTFFENHLRIGEVGLRDLELSFSQISKDVDSGNHSNVSALIIEFENRPTMMTVGAFSPAWDFNLKPLQSISDFSTPLQDVSLSVLQSNSRSHAAIVWPKSSTIGHQFASSLLDQPRERISTLLIKLSFNLIENTCLNKNWWATLKGAQQHVLKMWMLPEDQNAGMYAFSGVSFDDWVYTNHHFVNV
ncbi:MAG: hypothetical protein QM576_16025 [Rhodopseudomonas sp.]|uniref:hypothetical protein n=1 Tax=Rhodopseudomonas sp. TaxID=1078 RepID=UPI0039E39B94